MLIHTAKILEKKIICKCIGCVVNYLNSYFSYDNGYDVRYLKTNFKCSPYKF